MIDPEIEASIVRARKRRDDCWNSAFVTAPFNLAIIWVCLIALYDSPAFWLFFACGCACTLMWVRMIFMWRRQCENVKRLEKLVEEFDTWTKEL